MLLYENKKIDTKEPDETDGDGDGDEMEIYEDSRWHWQGGR
jgi:hypothetical protein